MNSSGRVVAHRFADPRSFLTRAERFLMRTEVENIVMLSLGGPPGAPPVVLGEDAYLAVAEHEGEVIACAVRLPPDRVLISRMGREAQDCLIADLAATYTTLPGVHGPEPDVSSFAERWSHHCGLPARLGMRLRLFEARRVQPPETRPGGRLRVAEEEDLPTIAEWARAFRSDADPYNPSDPDEEARRRISACVADLTQHLLAEGHVFCCLFTDLANPTSNRIYQRIGYRPVCDMSDFILNGA